MRFAGWRSALLAVCCMLLPLSAQALEFRSIAAPSAVLYDAPSLQAKKLYLLSQFYPVEIIIRLEHWVKVRDSAGGLAWIELKQLSDKRMVLVTAPLADIRQSSDPHSPLAFQAERDVALELTEYSGNGWIKVRHRDGQTGFIQVSQVWGI